MADPYEVLGVAKTADADEIQRAYRRLAKRYHPDLNPGNAEAEARFKDIAAAHALLSDPEKRSRFDRGEIDAAGQERPPERSFYRGFGDGAAGARYRSEGSFSTAEDLESFIGDLFGAGTGRRSSWFSGAGADLSFRLRVSFLDAARGTRKPVTLPDGRALDIDIPAGIADGQTLRLRGIGQPAAEGQPPGDALVTIEVEPHALFRRDGADIRIDLPVAVTEAVLGAKVRVPTIDGPVTLTIPPRSNGGKTLRLRGRGVADRAGGRRGDQYVTLRLVLPDPVDGELEDFLRRWAEAHPQDPRRGLEGLS